MKKPKYFKGAKHKKKDLKEPVVEKSNRKHFSSKAEFPKNSRPIPEAPQKKTRMTLNTLVGNFKKRQKLHLWVQGWNMLAIILLCVIGLQMVHSLRVLQEKNKERQALETQLNKWEAFSMIYPGSRDSYIHLAVLAYTLGDRNEALSYIQKAQTLDPNNDTIVQLEELIAKMGK